jgi:hypothetical protein
MVSQFFTVLGSVCYDREHVGPISLSLILKTHWRSLTISLFGPRIR